MFTGNILYQHLVMDPERCWQRFTLGSRLLSTQGQGFSFAPKSKTEDHFLVSEVGDWHRYTTSPHRLDQMSISPSPLGGNKNVLRWNEELPIVEWVECRRKNLTCDLGMCGFGPPSARHLVKCVGIQGHWWIQILPWVYVSGFFLAGVSVLNLCIYPKLASGAMCMEVSSVFLSTYLGDIWKIPENPMSSKGNVWTRFSSQVEIWSLHETRWALQGTWCFVRSTANFAPSSLTWRQLFLFQGCRYGSLFMKIMKFKIKSSEDTTADTAA